MRVNFGRPNSALGSNVGRVREGDTHARLQIRLRDGAIAGFQHFAGNIDTEKLRVLVTPCRRHQIAAGAAADFQHMISARRIEAADQEIAAEQIIAAREIVDIPLAAIHPIHRDRGGHFHNVFPLRMIFSENRFPLFGIMR